MIQGWKFFARYQQWSDSLQLFARYTDHRGHMHMVQPLSLVSVEPGAPYDAATLSTDVRLADDDTVGDASGFLQAAMDAGWEMGLRPKGFGDHANEMTAVRYHLEDMRKLAKVDRK